jgi:hypothetical protein
MAKWARLFRIVTVVSSISVFTYWFIKKSAVAFVDNSVGCRSSINFRKPWIFILSMLIKLMVPLGLILNISVKYARNITE